MNTRQSTLSARGRDDTDLTVEKVFKIKTTNLPEAPTLITLDNDSVEENQKKGATVGNLLAVDEDAGEKHTFKLIDDPSGEPNDNSKFSLSGIRLRTNEPFDFESQPTLNIYVEVKDRGTYAQRVTVNVLDANDAPTGLTIDNDSIIENQPTKTVIGKLSAVDPDAADRHTYKIVGGKDMKFFASDGEPCCE